MRKNHPGPWGVHDINFILEGPHSAQEISSSLGVIYLTGIKGCHLEILPPWPSERLNGPPKVLSLIIPNQISGVGDYPQTRCCVFSEEAISSFSPRFLDPGCDGGREEVLPRWHLPPTWAKHLQHEESHHMAWAWGRDQADTMKRGCGNLWMLDFLMTMNGGSDRSWTQITSA